MNTKVKEKMEEVKATYHDSEVVMGEMLASVPADGLSMEEAFFLYVAALNWANGDEFTQILGDNEEEGVNLVLEAKKMIGVIKKQRNNLQVTKKFRNFAST